MDLEHLKSLCEKATKGPWQDHNWDPMERPHVVADALGGGSHCRGQADIPATAHDAAFIAASRTAVPELIREVERLRVVVEAARWLTKNCEYGLYPQGIVMVRTPVGDVTGSNSGDVALARLNSALVAIDEGGAPK